MKKINPTVSFAKKVSHTLEESTLPLFAACNHREVDHLFLGHIMISMEYT